MGLLSLTPVIAFLLSAAGLAHRPLAVLTAGRVLQWSPVALIEVAMVALLMVATLRSARGTRRR